MRETLMTVGHKNAAEIENIHGKKKNKKNRLADFTKLIIIFQGSLQLSSGLGYIRKPETGKQNFE